MKKTKSGSYGGCEGYKDLLTGKTEKTYVILINL